MTGEATVRHALRRHLVAMHDGTAAIVAEFWLPGSQERADLALINGILSGFEIKSERDTLKRLPRQVAAYGRVFDCCTAVLAEKLSERGLELLPTWWGVTIVSVNGSVEFTHARQAQCNPDVDPEILVRLLWRDEVWSALTNLGASPSPRATRFSMWNELLQTASLPQLRQIVCGALLGRSNARARMPSRRFTPPVAPPPAGQ